MKFSQNSKGFTLLEILIALGLSTIIMLTVTRLIAYGAEVWYDSDVTIKATENDTIALNFVRKMLDDAKPVYWENALGSSVLAFDGQEDIFYFVAPLPVVSAEAMGSYLFAFTVETPPETNNPALVVKYWPFNETSLEETLSAEARTEVLMSDVSQLQVAYFGYEDDPTLQEPQWQSEWREKNIFPMAIRLDISRVAYDERRLDSTVRQPWENIVIAINQRSVQ